MTPLHHHQPEKIEQAHLVQLLRSIGARVYVLGTHRRRSDHQGTMQTPGLPDVLAFLPRGGGLLAVEAKAPRGRLRPEQLEFRELCLACAAPHQVHHVVGGLNAVIFYLIHLGLLKPEHVPHYRLPTLVQKTDPDMISTESGH